MEIVQRDNTLTCILYLKRKKQICPYCHGKTIGHGHKKKIIKHPVLTEHKCNIEYYANRYLCKECTRTFLEDNPFTFRGFNASFVLLRSVMNKLADLHYTLKMIAQELHISPAQINTYLDSYVTIPPLPLPECLGIDEIHNPEMSYKGSAYLCVLVDNEKRLLRKHQRKDQNLHRDIKRNRQLRKIPQESVIRLESEDLLFAYRKTILA